METDERYRRGGELIREVWGEGFGAEIMRRQRDISPGLERQIVEFMYGDLWSRPSPPGPDRKTRSLATVAILCALNRAHQLRVHLVGALNNGATETEIEEIILMAGLLAGFPASWDGMIQARKVFEEHRAGAFAGATAAEATKPSFE
jgi:4-carboxymuconolactone decarboxylase